MNKKFLIGALLITTTTAFSGMAQARDGRDGHRSHRFEGHGHGGYGGYGGHGGHGGYGGGRGYSRPYGGGVGVGVGILGFGLGYYAGTRNSYSYVAPYYPPVYSTPYYPQTIVVPPPVYIEQSPPQVVQAPAASYWYFCANPDGYYPYIKECPGGWQTVPAAPPPQDLNR